MGLCFKKCFFRRCIPFLFCTFSIVGFLYIASAPPWISFLFSNVSVWTDYCLHSTEKTASHRKISLDSFKTDLKLWPGIQESETTSSDKNRIWPTEGTIDDRIANQLTYVPDGYDDKAHYKTILLSWDVPEWLLSLLAEVPQCPVNKCNFTTDTNTAGSADAVIFRGFAENEFKRLRTLRPSYQIWIMYEMESPANTQYGNDGGLINWTATYRLDSDIVLTYPFKRWFYHKKEEGTRLKDNNNYAFNKPGKVAWLVSNCNTRSQRFMYAYKLQKYIDVDIYGRCGSHKCPKDDSCLEYLGRRYKFYLAFENSHCYQYITEKLFINALENNMLPIVMGARPEDYELLAPKHSYIHVEDFDSPASLATYLKLLDSNDHLYNSYFLWKNQGHFADVKFFCRVCALLHDNYPIKWYPNLFYWWAQSRCTKSEFWRCPRR